MTPNATKTVAALLTPAAPGAIAVIGLHGPATLDVLAAIARRPSTTATTAWAVRRPTFCRIVDGPDVVDDAIVTLGPDDSTSRAEIHVHGGVRIAQRVLMLLQSRGALVVSPREFPDVLLAIDPVTRRIDETLQSAGSRKMASWLLSQRDRLPAFLDRLDSLTTNERRQFDARSRIAGRLVRGMTVALVGPPNAGKSTLANRLIGSDRVITSDIPGTTRDWVSETALLGGWPVTLVDTAGIRETPCEIETEAMRRGAEQAARADLILAVIDSTQPPEESSRVIAELRCTVPARPPMILVANKCDLANATGVSPADGVDCRISATEGTGIADLESKACRALGLHLLEPESPAAFFPPYSGEAP